MIHQILVSRGKNFDLGQVVDSRAQAIRSVPDGTPPESLAAPCRSSPQALKTLRETDVRSLQSRVRHRELNYRVVKSLTRHFRGVMRVNSDVDKRSCL